MQGRKPVEVQELHAGDLGAAVKLHVTLTGDTLGDKAHEIYHRAGRDAGAGDDLCDRAEDRAPTRTSWRRRCTS